MFTLDDVCDREAECINVRYPHVRAPECTGKIPAGEKHYLWRGVYAGSDPDEYARVCRWCVRKSNDKYFCDEELLVRVELTYSDGKKRYLEGEAAEEWQRAAGSTAVMSAVHGAEFPALKWVEVPPPPSALPPSTTPASSKRSCNRHDDCAAADARAKEKGRFAADHCHDECCEECFGS